MFESGYVGPDVERFVQRADDQIERQRCNRCLTPDISLEIAALPMIFRERLVFFQELDGDNDQAREVGVLRLPHFPHAPRPKALEELVAVRDHGVGRDRHSEQFQRCGCAHYTARVCRVTLTLCVRCRALR
jgi:hypothetical protein